MGKKSKNNKVAKLGPKRSFMNPLIKELYKLTADPTNPANIEEVLKLGNSIESKQATFISPSYNIDRVQAGNDLIEHIRSSANVEMNVEVVADEHGGVKLVSTRQSQESDLVLSIPIDQCITTINRDDQVPMDDFKKDPVISNMINVQLALNLLFEVFEGKDSNYYHYLRTLPANPKTILSMEMDELLPLKGSSIWMEVEPMIIAIYRQYARIYQLLQNSEGTQFERLRDGFTFSAYKWAVQIIQTRQNGYPGLNRMELNDLLLIPVVDLCNHDPEPSARISKSGSDNEKDLKLHLKLAKDTDEQGVLSLKYAPSTTSEFFVNLGFIPENLENDASRIRITLPIENATWRMSLLRLLPIVGPFKIGKEQIPFELINFVRIFLSSEERAKEKFEEMKTADSIDLSLDEDEPKVFEFLLMRLKLMIMRVDRALNEAPSDSVAERLLQNEKNNFADAAEYIQSLQA